jgi:TPR repeat protein
MACFTPSGLALGEDRRARLFTPVGCGKSIANYRRTTEHGGASRLAGARFVVSETSLAPTTLAEAEEIVGFFSYSREDDDDSRGALSALRDAIQRELRGQLGRSRQQLRLWQDKEAITPGRLWESEIKAAVEQAVFFIPIITPTVVKSRYCQTEFEAFLTRERALERSDLVFPILYIRVPELEVEARWRDHPVLSVIGARQWMDWRHLRLHPIDDITVRQAIEQFCANIVAALHAPTPSPEELERRRHEEELRRQEAARLAQEAEQRQRAEEARAREQQEEELRRQEEARLAREAQQRRAEEEAQARKQEEELRAQETARLAQEAEQCQREEAERRRKEEEEQARREQQEKAQAEEEARREEAARAEVEQRQRDEERERQRQQDQPSASATQDKKDDSARAPSGAGASPRRKALIAASAAAATGLVILVLALAGIFTAPSRQVSTSPGAQPQAPPVAQPTPAPAPALPAPQLPQAAPNPSVEQTMQEGWAAYDRHDYAEAMRWYRKAADQGNAAAQTNIGYLYYRGWGVAQDYAEAMRWYRKAADQGNATAQNNIGELYYFGHGVPTDFSQAMIWYRKAADQGNAAAQYNVGYLYDKGLGVTRDPAQARIWMQKAAAGGDADAKAWLSQHPAQ